MKIMKRIIVAVLVVALLAAAFAFAASAEDTKEYAYRVPGINVAENILEYYTLDDYVADNYDDGSLTDELVVKRNPTVSYVTDPTDPDGDKVLSVVFPRSGAYFRYEKKSDASSMLTDKLIVSFKFYVDPANAGKSLEFYLNAGVKNGNGVNSLSDNTVLSFNFAKGDKDGGTVQFSSWNEDKQQFDASLQTFEAVKIGYGEWYDVNITFDASSHYFKFSIVDGEGTSYASDNFTLGSAMGITSFKLGGGFVKDAKAGFLLDDVQIYEGTVNRDPSYKFENTKTHLEDLDAFYNLETTDHATKLRIADVIRELYSFDEEAFPAELRAVIPNATKYMNETYAKEFVDQVNAINTANNYVKRLAHYDVMSWYESLLPVAEDMAGAPGITEEYVELVSEARVKLNAENAELAIVQEQSLAFVDYMLTYEDDNRSYEYMTKFYARATAEDLAKVDMEYPHGDMPKAVENFFTIETKVNEVVANVDKFIMHVQSMEVASTYGTMYTAYVDAAAVYNGGVIHPQLDNDTYSLLWEKVQFFLNKEPGILSKKAECDYFIMIVNEAAISSYYTSIVEKIALADAAYPTIAFDYEGIVDSVNTYFAIKDAVVRSEEKAEEYIAAVEAIANADGFYAKKAAIAAAADLKANGGDVLGYDGVKEANILLAEETSTVNFLEGNSVTLINLVETIKATKSIKERRALILLAKAAAENCEEEYEGVAKALEGLNAEIEKFTADVNAANASIQSASFAAVAVVGSVSGSQIFVNP